ncbi:hypothetical protein IAU60_000096 [Kwoniella sp. DSM 27419]
MATQEDRPSLGSLRPPWSRKGQLRGQTSDTFHHWVDIDPVTGDGRLLHVGDDPVNLDHLRRPSSSSLMSVDTDRTTRNKSLFKRAGLDDDHDSRGGRLKRRSMQLLRMVSGETRHDRKLSISTPLRNTGSHSIDLGMSPHPSRDTSSASSYASFEPPPATVSTPVMPTTRPLDRGHLPRRDASLCTPTSMHHSPPLSTSMRSSHASSHQSMSSSSRHRPKTYAHRAAKARPGFGVQDLVEGENTPPAMYTYPGYAGDSDSSGKKPTLRPMYSAAPHNTPLSDAGEVVRTSTPTRASGRDCLIDTPTNARIPAHSSAVKQHRPPATKRTLTLETLRRHSLSMANRQLSRAEIQIDVVLPLSGLSLHDGRVELSPSVKQSEDDSRARFEDAEESGPNVEGLSSALEALWEYGSSGSSAHGHVDQKSASEGKHERARADSYQVELDMMFGADEYPLPPPLSSLPTVHSLALTPETNLHDSIPDLASRKASSRSPPRTAALDSVDTAAMAIPVPTFISAPRTSVNSPLSSPLSDGDLSLADDLEDYLDTEPGTVHNVAVAYRLPLKFERPTARRRASLSVDSPFVDLYRATDPHAVNSS